MMLNNSQLRQRGLEALDKIDGKQGEAVKQALEGFAPDLAGYLLINFGEFYNRPYLGWQQRELVTLAALAAQGGCEKQLHVHIHAALNVGLSREQIIETFIHCIPYLGFPKVLNAIYVAKDILADAQQSL